MQALLHSVSPTLQQATANPHLHQRLLDTHRQVWVSLLWGHCSFLLGPGVHKFLFVPSKSLFPQSCVSYDGSIVGLMATSSKRVYAILGSVHPEPLPLRQSTADCPSTGDTQTQFWLSLCGVSGSWCIQVLFEPIESLEDMGFNSKRDFTPSTILLGLLLCPWMWGISFWWDPTFSCQQLFSSNL